MSIEQNLVFKAPEIARTHVAADRAKAQGVRTGAHSTSYRPDIDGLRAVAVLLVLVFHGGLAVFPSGFIGVDIFFVISGYLTTSIILSAVARGDFSLGQFYVKRLWRLQPAILALLIVTLAAASVLYLPKDFIDFLKSEKYTSLLLSNQYFSKATDGYATAEAATLPLLHTWSLAIEWQWYIFLPLGLMALTRYLAPRQLKTAVLMLTIAAIAVALFIAKTSPDKSYYAFVARIFELLIGSCAAVYASDRQHLGRVSASVVGLGALGVLLYGATQSIPTTAYPGYPAIVICLATAVLVSGQVGQVGITSRLLSWSPLVFIGTISYSLYLWHWPVIAIVDYLGFEKTPAILAGYFIASFALGITSYYLIEKPLRRTRLGVGQTLILLLVVPAIAFSALHSAGKASVGWMERFGSDQTHILPRLKASEIPPRGPCLGGASDGSDSKCLLGQANAKTTALLMGDSYSNHFWGFMDVLAKDANLSVMAQGSPGCLALPDVYLYDWWKYKNTLYKKCHDAAAEYHRLIARSHYDYVIIGLTWETYANSRAVVLSIDDERSQALSRERMKAALLKSLDIIERSGARPVLLKSNIVMPEGANDCLYRSIKLRGTLEEHHCATSVAAPKEDPWLAQLFEAAKQAHPDVLVIDPKDVQCTDGQCKLSIDGLPIYRDIGHITDFASTAMGKMYLQAKGNPFTESNP
ncbi:acyltransferase family protein [Pseudomonas guariconensis]|uniref:acyltransferase family protein n=1 Tax=Pseudomonas guariconensis TaxID=1288410 RepID=UPI002B051AA4|nr:acyltransferase family protein [Pseudomonas guariconensis]